MKVLLTTPLRQYTGEIIKDGEADLMIRIIFLRALSIGGDQDTTWTEKARQYALGLKIASSSDEVDLEVDELKILKDLVSKAFSSLLAGQVGKMLDGLPTGIMPK